MTTKMANGCKRKLIEVAMPLEAISTASVREKSKLHGHPSTLHIWWARRPLAACRAVLFAQLVDDPSNFPERFPTKDEVDAERQRLFGIIRELVVWENSFDERLLKIAREEIRQSCGKVCPKVHDPFSGGGAIPIEAQRLGLSAAGSDLNPVAVLIGKSAVEFPLRFADRTPAHPGTGERFAYRNAEGLAEDVRFYGKLALERASASIGRLYPKAELPPDLGGVRPMPSLGSGHEPSLRPTQLSAVQVCRSRRLSYCAQNLGAKHGYSLISTGRRRRFGSVSAEAEQERRLRKHVMERKPDTGRASGASCREQRLLQTMSRRSERERG